MCFSGMILKSILKNLGILSGLQDRNIYVSKTLTSGSDFEPECLKNF